MVQGAEGNCLKMEKETPFESHQKSNIPTWRSWSCFKAVQCLWARGGLQPLEDRKRQCGSWSWSYGGVSPQEEVWKTTEKLQPNDREHEQQTSL